jgi:membrane protease YdiL (CAAX protease family)
LKTRGLGLCVLVLSILLIVSMAFNTTSLSALQRQYLGWNYFSHGLMVVLGISMMVIRRADFRSYGFTLRHWRTDLSMAVVCLLMWVGFFVSSIPLFSGNMLMGALFEIASCLLALRFVSTKRAAADAKTDLPVTPLILVTPFIQKGNVALTGFRLIASTAVFQFFGAGFGEEILFRGYMQSRLNEDFGRPWSFRGVSFGPGLLVSSALFGVLHLFNAFNPFLGIYSLSPLWAVTSFFAGLVFGFVREKTGTVLSASLAHGLVDLGQVVPLLL